MAELINIIQNCGGGFFYFFGFSKNPAENAAYRIIEIDPSEKIKSDLKKINSDYRKTLKSLQKELGSIG
ncbi:MAG: hypothetical protein R2794_11790 [Chitinophagales bacterium]